ncbi:hypothetical protein LAJ19_20595 (plasmid) [Deinococcus taeanensis]|uniref:hypothetical protein n=1 Tax=Deinococcus taeanensis TaxID=2737050 RepID=UPI001CDCC32F|nr:hypothetical protein [Deinococcus taeanensis]UBV45209.1 hypothetical protein LAJ19_20595 [Deinococcus taeanensis]
MHPVWAASLLLLCSACGPVDVLGADFLGRENARKYIAACARSTTDVYCKALLPTLQSVSGEVTVILVTLGDEDRTAAIELEMRRQGLNMNGFVGSAAADRFARANIFLASRVASGTMTSLDGKTHTVTCSRDARNTDVCLIDGMVREHNANDGVPDAEGNIFVTDRVLRF